MWTLLKDFPNYEISTLGEIKSLTRKVMTKNSVRLYKQSSIKPLLNKTNGYLYVYIKNNKGKYKGVLIHRLVAQTFIPNPTNKPEVNHKNGIKTDNRVENLEWVSRESNIRHAFANGLISKTKMSISSKKRKRKENGRFL